MVHYTHVYDGRKLADLEAAKVDIVGSVPSAAIECVPVDVTDHDRVKAAFTQCQKTSGSVHTLICCAGAAITGKMVDIPVSDFKKGMDLNYFGTIHCVK